MTTGEGDLKSAAPTLRSLYGRAEWLQEALVSRKYPYGTPEYNYIHLAVAELVDGLKANLEAPPAAERTAQRDAALEIRTRIIDILDECDRTVYAQQKWKVARAGLQGWLFKVEAENPEIIKEVADATSASEGTKSE